MIEAIFQIGTINSTPNVFAEQFANGSGGMFFNGIDAPPTADQRVTFDDLLSAAQQDGMTAASTR